MNSIVRGGLLKPREIVELLQNHGQLTLPKIAKMLGANVGSVDHHLKKLSAKGIVKVKKKPYGTLYSLSEELTSVSGRVKYELAFTFVFTVAGIFLLSQMNFVYASASLLISSITGTFSVIRKAHRQKTERIRQILETL